MASVTLSVPDEVKLEMKKLSWINWSELARREAEMRLEEEKAVDEFKEIVSKSKLTKEDALKLAREVNRSLHKRYKKLYPKLE